MSNFVLVCFGNLLHIILSQYWLLQITFHPIDSFFEHPKTIFWTLMTCIFRGFHFSNIWNIFSRFSLIEHLKSSTSAGCRRVRSTWKLRTIESEDQPEYFQTNLREIVFKNKNLLLYFMKASFYVGITV